jgi:hypothetical protein
MISRGARGSWECTHVQYCRMPLVQSGDTGDEIEEADLVLEEAGGVVLLAASVQGGRANHGLDRRGGVSHRRPETHPLRLVVC